MASYRNEGRLTGLTTSGFQFLVQSLSKLDIFTRIGDEDVDHISYPSAVQVLSLQSY